MQREPRLPLERGQVGLLQPRVVEVVEVVDDRDPGAPRQELAREVGADEAGAARHEVGPAGKRRLRHIANHPL